jgi:cytochrome c oxidase subunit 4
VAETQHHSKDPAEAELEHGTGRYWLVWAALIAGTFLTVITGRRDLGEFNIYIAMIIATTKASLVVLFFMHMIDTPTANRIVFVVSLVFAVVLIVGVFGDLLTRNEMTLPSAAPSTEGPEIEGAAPAGTHEPAPPGHE